MYFLDSIRFFEWQIEQNSHKKVHKEYDRSISPQKIINSFIYIFIHWYIQKYRITTEYKEQGRRAANVFICPINQTCYITFESKYYDLMYAYLCKSNASYVYCLFLTSGTTITHNFSAVTSFLQFNGKVPSIKKLVTIIKTINYLRTDTHINKIIWNNKNKQKDNNKRILNKSIEKKLYMPFWNFNIHKLTMDDKQCISSSKWKQSIKG